MKVLVIDDEKDIGQLLEDAISESISVTDIIKAYHGAEGLLACQKHEFGIIICDYQMPIMNGLEFLTILRKLQNPNQNVPVILFSSFIPAVKDEAEVYEAVYFVDKPLKMKHFINLVSMLTKKPIRKAM